MYRRIALVLLFFALGAIGSFVGSEISIDAAAADFLGTWINTDPNTGGIATLVISPLGANYTIHEFGACSPTPCDNGTTTLNLLGYNVSDTNPLWGLASYDFGFLAEYLVIHREGDLLVVESYNVFQDNSGRSSFRSLSLMRR